MPTVLTTQSQGKDGVASAGSHSRSHSQQQQQQQPLTPVISIQRLRESIWDPNDGVPPVEIETAYHKVSKAYKIAIKYTYVFRFKQQEQQINAGEVIRHVEKEQWIEREQFFTQEAYGHYQRIVKASRHLAMDIQNVVCLKCRCCRDMPHVPGSMSCVAIIHDPMGVIDSMGTSMLSRLNHLMACPKMKEVLTQEELATLASQTSQPTTSPNSDHHLRSFLLEWYSDLKTLYVDSLPTSPSPHPRTTVTTSSVAAKRGNASGVNASAVAAAEASAAARGRGPYTSARDVAAAAVAAAATAAARQRQAGNDLTTLNHRVHASMQQVQQRQQHPADAALKQRLQQQIAGQQHLQHQQKQPLNEAQQRLLADQYAATRRQYLMQQERQIMLMQQHQQQQQYQAQQRLPQLQQQQQQQQQQQMFASMNQRYGMMNGVALQQQLMSQQQQRLQQEQQQRQFTMAGLATIDLVKGMRVLEESLFCVVESIESDDDDGENKIIINNNSTTTRTSPPKKNEPPFKTAESEVWVPIPQEVYSQCLDGVPFLPDENFHKKWPTTSIFAPEKIPASDSSSCRSTPKRKSTIISRPFIKAGINDVVVTDPPRMGGVYESVEDSYRLPGNQRFKRQILDLREKYYYMTVDQKQKVYADLARRMLLIRKARFVRVINDSGDVEQLPIIEAVCYIRRRLENGYADLHFPQPILQIPPPPRDPQSRGPRDGCQNRWRRCRVSDIEIVPTVGLYHGYLKWSNGLSESSNPKIQLVGLKNNKRRKTVAGAEDQQQQSSSTACNATENNTTTKIDKQQKSNEMNIGHSPSGSTDHGLNDSPEIQKPSSHTENGTAAAAAAETPPAIAEKLPAQTEMNGHSSSSPMNGFPYGQTAEKPQPSFRTEIDDPIPPAGNMIRAPDGVFAETNDGQHHNSSSSPKGLLVNGLAASTHDRISVTPENEENNKAKSTIEVASSMNGTNGTPTAAAAAAAADAGIVEAMI
jgi:hypothetical protein